MTMGYRYSCSFILRLDDGSRSRDVGMWEAGRDTTALQWGGGPRNGSGSRERKPNAAGNGAVDSDWNNNRGNCH